MQTSHNLMWLLISAFFAVLLAMVFGTWRRHDEALARKLRELNQPPFDAVKARQQAHAHHKGEELARVMEEIDLKVQTGQVAADAHARYQNARVFALRMMIGVGIVLAAGILYGLYRFIAGA